MEILAEAIVEAAKIISGEQSVTIFAIVASPVVALLIFFFSLSSNRTSLDMQFKSQSEQLERQLLATIRSEKRQAWINDLRSEIASILANINIMDDLLKKGFVAPGGTVPMEYADAEGSAYLSYSKIRLLMNPKENLHQNLVSDIDALVNNFLHNRSSTNQSLLNNIVTNSQAIFKEEWIRVKSGN